MPTPSAPNLTSIAASAGVSQWAGQQRGAVIERSILGLDGEPLAPVETDRTICRQLQAHASFPDATASIGAETIQTPLGALECVRYAVAVERQVIVMEKVRSAKAPPESVTRARNE